MIPELGQATGNASIEQKREKLHLTTLAVEHGRTQNNVQVSEDVDCYQNTGEQSERVRGAKPFEDKDSRTTPMAGGKNMLTAEGWCRPGLTTGYLPPLALDETSQPERKQIASYRQVDISAL